MREDELEEVLVDAGLADHSDVLLAPCVRLFPQLAHARGRHSVSEGEAPCPDCRLGHPVEVDPLPLPAVQAAVGRRHALGLLADASLVAWGAGGDHLGMGDGLARRSPARIASIRDPVVSVAAGSLHSLAVTHEGSVLAWGFGGQGALGLGDVTSERFPRRVPLPSPARAVFAAGGRSFALLQDGTLRAWGGGFRSYLGHGGTGSAPNPIPVLGLTAVTDVAVSAYHALAITEDGIVWAWGHNADGQLGDGTTTDQEQPVPVTVLPAPPSAIAAGDSHSVALIDGRVWAWGRNLNGQLGDGTTTSRSKPRAIPLPKRTQAVAAGFASTVAVLEDGSVWSWGENSGGQLGDGTVVRRLIPVSTDPHLTRVSHVKASGDRVVVLRDDGGVVQWGGQDPSPATARPGSALVGATKFGGLPDLSPDTEWPIFGGEPQAFIAQVNFADIHALVDADDLPACGLLSFFAAQGDHDGSDPADRGACAVQLHENTSTLARRTFPEGLREAWRFAETTAVAERQHSMCAKESFTIEWLNLDKEHLSAFENAYSRYDDQLGEAPRHRLLGHPEPVQNDMQAECQLVTHGFRSWSYEVFRGEDGRRLWVGSKEWRLLLQVDSDDGLGFCWGDAGRLYFWIKRDDLAARRFSAVWCMLQQS